MKQEINLKNTMFSTLFLITIKLFIMENIEICSSGTSNIFYYVKVNPKWFNVFKLHRYLWESSKTKKLYLTKDISCATKFKTREEAMLCAENYFQQIK